MPAHGYAAARRGEILQSLGALTVMVNSLSGVPGRKAVLHVSDGFPATPGEELFQFLTELCGINSGTSGMHGPTSRSAGPEAERRVQQQQEEAVPESNPSLGKVVDVRAYNADSQAAIDAQSYSIAKQLAALIAHANAHQVTLYTLQASGLEGTSAADASYGPEDRMLQFTSIDMIARMSRQESLQSLAEGTGGKAILNANDVRADLAGLREDFSTFYSLGYTPAHSGDGRDHRIEVAVEAPRHPPALPRELPRQADAGKGRRPYPGRPALRARRQPAGGRDRDRRADARAGRDGLRTRAPPHPPLQADDPEPRRELRGEPAAADRHPRRGGPDVSHAAGGRPLKIPRKEVLNAMGQSYLYTLTLQLPPGGQRIAVGVRDDLAATTSYLSHAVQVGVASAAAARPEVA